MKKNDVEKKKKKLYEVSCRMCGAGRQLYFFIENEWGEKIFTPVQDIVRGLYVSDPKGKCPKCGGDALERA